MVIGSMGKKIFPDSKGAKLNIFSGFETYGDFGKNIQSELVEFCPKLSH